MSDENFAKNFYLYIYNVPVFIVFVKTGMGVLLVNDYITMNKTAVLFSVLCSCRYLNFMGQIKKE